VEAVPANARPALCAGVELLRLRRGESIDTVLAERKSGRARETAGSEDSPRHLLDRLANNLTKILAAAGKLNPHQK